jgi:predicted DsbA family dithiol-disulfide isomerase
MNQEKIKIEIWSDVACPFCYLGKKRFERAVETLGFQDRIEVRWKSFQLNPDMETNTELRIHQYLSQVKGIPESQALAMNKQITAAGAAEGIAFHFDKAIVANTRQAHYLIQQAAHYNKQDAIESALFKAYFSEGKNIDDPAVLNEIATSCEVPFDGRTESLEAGVLYDSNEAAHFGIRGVPFFVFDRKFAVSGAQDPSVFESALTKASKKSEA